MNTRMVYGPFDLSDALGAEARFWLWLQIETGFDEFSFYASHDGVIFDQLQSWDVDTETWEEIVIDTGVVRGGQ